MFRTFSSDSFALSLQDVVALRRAEDVSFYWKDNQATITAYYPKPKGADEQPYRDIKVGYRFSNLRDNREPISCSVHKMGLKSIQATPAQTLVRFLRAGDQVDLHFWVDNSNGYLEGAWSKTDNAGEGKLHRDELVVVITRGKKEYAFLISVSICLDNSARLVKFQN